MRAASARYYNCAVSATGTDRRFPVTGRCVSSQPARLLQRRANYQLQSVQNAAARLIFAIRRSEHITDALASLYWLRVPERILFKVAFFTYRTVNGSAPAYLSSYFTRIADLVT